MRSPLRWLRRRLELMRQAPRRREVEQEFASACGHPVKLVNAAAKGGYDEIYYALNAGKRFAVVRINSPFKSQIDPIGPLDPGVPLDAPARLEREWQAYELLFPLGLSPRPLWRTHDAIACSWIEWDRVSQRLIRNRQEFWPMMEKVLPAIRRMHDAGVTHLDLNLGNMLAQPGGPGIAFIDFEFGPVPWVNSAQQRAFDYLRLIDDCIKKRRGGQLMLADIPRLVQLLKTHVDLEARQAQVQFTRQKLTRLDGNEELCRQLRRVFEHL
ncbi:lipopolysaccharide kinase InaA family protein [Planctomicrobium sp. SH661]|uniref:lipopolysaccharide kinase InaA family protein n=1 Tax=Planctomicrobium sp. SH661 TaxID=3448124 RepID=UPI003F5CAEAA